MKLKDDVAAVTTTDGKTDAATQKIAQVIDSSGAGTKGCSLCSQTFTTVEEQRSHMRSDLHNYNLKQRLRNAKAVTENEFETLVQDLDESLSGSDDSQSEDEIDGSGSVLSNLLRKQATIAHGDEHGNEDGAVLRRGGQPTIWFTSNVLPSNVRLGVYRSIFSKSELEGSKSIPEVLQSKQLQPKKYSKDVGDINKISSLQSEDVGSHIFMCMIGGGHFAAMIVALAPKVTTSNGTGLMSKEAVVVAHKTFHRYTTRRKQGGSQSANDNAKGAANSAGAQIRRYNEIALIEDVRALLGEWKHLIDTADLCFVRAPGMANRRTLFGPYEGQVLKSNDPRIRSFPFNTRRATQKELMRSFIELTRLKVQQVDEEAIAAAKAAAEAAQRQKNESKPDVKAVPKRSEADEEAELQTTQIQALIKRSKLPALIAYMKDNSLDSTFRFYPTDSPQTHHAPTPLHLAASQNSPVIVTGLLSKGLADPAVPNGDGRLAYDLAGDRPTRDAFRLARSKCDTATPKIVWDWDRAHVPSPLSEADIEARKSEEMAEAKKAEEQRRKAEIERLKKEGPKVADKSPLGKAAGRGRALALGAAGKTAQENMEEEARGLTPEMRMRLERERRARAAEERFKKMQSGGN